MDLTGTQIKNTYGNVITIGAVAGSPQTGTLQNGAGENITSATLTGGTVTTSNPLLNMTQTWNDAGVTFTSLKLNVTDTASASASLLLDLQVGGSSKFNVSKDGRITIPSSNSVGIYTDGTFPAKLFMVDGFNGGTGFLFAGYNTASAAFNLYMEASGEWTFRARGSATLSWTDNGNNATVGTRDLILARDAAQTLAQRNSTNAQTFNIYNTYTDGSNYERGFLKWDSNTLKIGTEVLGTGTARGLLLDTGGRVASINIGGTYNTVAVSGILTTNSVFTVGTYIEASEMTAPSAPSADKVRIYAEDNGSGKTRLMAIFPSGAAQQIAIEP